MRTHLSHTLHIFTNMCSPHGKPCSIKLNLILDSSFLCCAWLCCHTHAHHTCLCFSSILPPPCSCIMPLISVMPALDSIGRFGTNMYTLQGIDWHPQSDSLGVSPLKRTQSTPSLVSSSCHLVESLRQLTCFIGCFSLRMQHLRSGTVGNRAAKVQFSSVQEPLKLNLNLNLLPLA